MWLTMALSNWKWIVIASLAIALLTSIGYGKMVAAERDAKIVEIQSMKDAAQTYKTASMQTAKEINDGIPKLVEQAKASAVANYKKRYGVGNAACGIRADSLLTRHKDGVGEAVSTEVADGVPQPEFISACASDASVIEQWQQWARLNQLPVE